MKLPLSNPDYWRGIDAIEGLADKTDCIDLDFLHYKACKMNLDDIGYPIELYYSPKDLYTNYVLEQYKCKTPSHSIEVDSGDVVLDCGGCYGDTALYFAHKSSDKGSVYSFEFVPSNLEIWERNTKMNPKLAERIHLVKAPLWSESGQPLYIEGKGPASKVVAEPESKDALEVRTISIDDMVSEQNLSKVSFIKMDIEGAELQALKGAANTLRQYRPKLAICVYHDLEDFWTIPQYLEELDLGYRFYLRHFTIFQGETVLFAEA
ncbi:MAG: FkbM family methyltransferase [Akkermansiaceae bacterium]